MRKTGLEIELDIFLQIKKLDMVRGDVYVGSTRPFDRIEEDIVIRHLSGVDGWGGFEQTGIVVVNIHVPDITHSESSLLPNTSRLRELERNMLNWIENYPTGAYRLRTESTAEIIKDKEEHIVSFRIRYRYNITI